jgi:hypothetical protein
LNFAWTGAQCTTKDFTDPKSESESERMVIFNLLAGTKVGLLILMYLNQGLVHQLKTKEDHIIYSNQITPALKWLAFN